MAGAVFGEVEVSLFVAGAVFGEVHVSLFVAGAVFGKFKCHFSWQAQYSVKFGMIAGARNVVFFNTKCSWWAWKVTSVARRVADWRFHGRIMVGSCSDHARIGRELEMTFHPFSANFFEIRDGHFSRQAQYLVSLDYDACCSAHCK